MTTALAVSNFINLSAFFIFQTPKITLKLISKKTYILLGPYWREIFSSLVLSCLLRLVKNLPVSSSILWAVIYFVLSPCVMFTRTSQICRKQTRIKALILHRAFWGFTKYHITKTCTNCILCISLKLFTLNHTPPCTRNNAHKYMLCCHNIYCNEIFIFLTRDFT
jgi:hypothetical protein